MYYSCHCIKRNGLQHDCRRTGCGGEPTCLVLPDPVCAPSQLARARGLADPAALAAHINAQGGGGPGGSADSGSAGGKRFIVCELKGISQNISTDKDGKCCKCPTSNSFQSSQGGVSGGIACVCTFGPNAKPVEVNPQRSKCPCATGSSSENKGSMFMFDEATLKSIINSFDKKELAAKDADVVIGPGGRPRKASKNVAKEEPCTRPGCIHWQPPPPCVWDAPCKADCFETPPGIQPGRNPLTGGGISKVGSTSTKRSAEGHGSHQRGSHQSPARIKLLTLDCCTGCSAPGGGGSASGAPAAGLPVMVMKLC